MITGRIQVKLYTYFIHSIWTPSWSRSEKQKLAKSHKNILFVISRLCYYCTKIYYMFKCKCNRIYFVLLHSMLWCVQILNHQFKLVFIKTFAEQLHSLPPQFKCQISPFMSSCAWSWVIAQDKRIFFFIQYSFSWKWLSKQYYLM